MAIQSGQMGGGQGLGSIMGMIQKIGGGSSGSKTDGVLKGSSSSAPDPTLPQAPDSLPDNSTAIDRREASNAQDPNVLLHQGINIANDPSVPMDYETRLAVMQPLLEAKHFGVGGQSGQVKSGQNGGGNAGSAIGAVAALA